MVEVIHTRLGAHKTFSGRGARLEERRDRSETETVYLGGRSRIIDMNYIAQHISKETESEIHTNGTLLDGSQRTYRGTINFLREAVCSVGYESEHTLLFSPRVHNRAVSPILCDEENVGG